MRGQVTLETRLDPPLLRAFSLWSVSLTINEVLFLFLGLEHRHNSHEANGDTLIV